MRKKMFIFLALILAFDIIAVGFAFITRNNSRPDIDPQAPANQTTEPAEPFSRVSVVAVGDNLIHNTIYRQAAARSSSGYDFSVAYEKIADRIGSADLAILNQETIISTEHNVSSYPQFNSPPELGDEMIKIGFDVFNIATNHSLDCGEKGLISAINFWKSKGMPTTGAYLNAQEAEKITMNEVNGIKFAYLGFTQETNGLSLPSDSEVILVKAEDEHYLREKIMRAKTQADVVIVNAHWGTEYTHKQSEQQTELAKKLAFWGADIIIGTHPHVIQPLEYIENEDGRKTLVAYSLGNFISAQTRGSRMLGGMLNFDVVKNNATGKISLENVIFNATVTHYGKNASNIRVYPLDDYTAELADSHGVKSETPSFSLTYLYDILDEVIDDSFLDKSKWKK